MIIITAVIYSIPYFICLAWFLHLRKQNSKLRTELFKKLSDSETLFGNEHKELRNLLRADFRRVQEKDKKVQEMFNQILDVSNKNVSIQNENFLRQNKNWENAKKKFDELDRINEEHLEIFQEFDYIIQELDKKVNEVSDEQEEILMRKDLDTQQINIVCEKLERLTLKRDRYENRLTEVCKVVDDLKGKVNEQSHGLNIAIQNILTRASNNRVNNVITDYREEFAFIRGEINSINTSLNKPSRTNSDFQAENLKKILENPIEVTRPSCETKFKIKQQVNPDDVETVTEIVNRVDFTWYNLHCGKGTKFVLTDFSLNVLDLDGNLFKAYYLEDRTSLWKKVLEMNEPKPKRKYNKRNEKKETIKRVKP